MISLLGERARNAKRGTGTIFRLLLAAIPSRKSLSSTVLGIGMIILWWSTALWQAGHLVSATGNNLTVIGG
jgi:hypothetical protein